MEREKAKEMWRKWDKLNSRFCEKRDYHANLSRYGNHQELFEHYLKLCIVSAKQMCRLEFMYGLKLHIGFSGYMWVS